MRYRALVIEDDSTIADVLRMKLEREGHEVTVAPNQREAYHLVDEVAFDFALLDLRLPTHEGDMSPHVQVGFDILAHIRERFAPDKLPVIVMTAYEETSQTAVRVLKAGANDYITKPFDDSPVSLDEKLRDIASCIHRARQVSASPRNPKKHRIVLKPGKVEVDGIILDGRSADLIWILGKASFMLSFDEGAHKDPRMPAKVIAEAMDVKDHTVRQYVKRFRKWLAGEYDRRGLGSIADDAIVRNTRDWKGYDLNRETCELGWE